MTFYTHDLTKFYYDSTTKNNERTKSVIVKYYLLKNFNYFLKWVIDSKVIFFYCFRSFTLLYFAVSFEDLLERSDFIVSSCALNSSTENIFNKTAFAKMKKNCIFTNIAR